MPKEVKTDDLINRIHSWANVYIREARKSLSYHERDDFEERQNNARTLIIQILKGKKDEIAGTHN